MTIILAKDGVMCADSIVCTGSIMGTVAFPKIARVNGSLIGAAGYAADCWNVFEWFRGTKEKPPFLIGNDKDTEVDILMMKPDGSLWRNARGVEGFYPMPNGSAIGNSTGCNVAEAAIRLGYSVEDATALAITMVAGLGGAVQIERLENYPCSR